MEGQHDLEMFRPRESGERLVFAIEAQRTPLRTWLTLTGLAGVLIGFGMQASAHFGVALLLATAFVFAGYQVVRQGAARTILRFLDEGVEITVDARIWVRVPWERIKRVVMNAEGGATLDTGGPEAAGVAVANLAKDHLEKLLASELLPAHIEVVEFDIPRAKSSPGKTFALWLVLVFAFVVIWKLVAR